jgi:hypothetical protein
MEQEVQKLGFSRVSIFRPGLLERGKDARFIEKLACNYLFNFILFLKKYLIAVVVPSINILTVARAMKNLAIKQNEHPMNNEVDILDNSAIRNLNI